MIRTALIGAGKMGVSHLAILRAHPDVDLVAICEPTPFLTSNIQRHLKIETVKDHKGLRPAEIDAIVISTPNATHYDLAKWALGEGLHVFMEKPLCLNPEQSRDLANRAVDKNLVTQVGYHNRFLGTFQEMRRVIQDGVLGEIYHIEGRAYGQVVIKKKAGTTWRSKKSEGGGCLHDYACHVVDLMNFVYQPPVDVPYARLQKIFSDNVEDAVFAEFSYGDTCSGSLETNWSDQSHRKMSTTITVYGSSGKAVVDRQELRVYQAPGKGSVEYPEGWTIRYITELQQPVAFYLRGEEYTAQLDNFIGRINGGDPAVESDFGTAAATDSIIHQIMSKAS